MVQTICDGCRLEINGTVHKLRRTHYGIAPTVYDLCSACITKAIDAVGLRNTA